MPTPDVVLLDREEDIAVVTLNRPQAMNAVNAELAARLGEVFAAIDGAGDIRAVVITGAGTRAFCVGADLKNPPASADERYSQYVQSMGNIFQMGARIRANNKPVVAAINGYAMGGGLDIALACDFRVAASDAVFGASYINVGLIPGDGGTYYLPRLVGEARAKEILMLGHRFTAAQALEMGMLTKVVAREELAVAARDMARHLASLPAFAMSRMKALINEAYEVGLQTTMEHIIAAQRLCLESAEYREALRAFAEKRPPDFRSVWVR